MGDSHGFWQKVEVDEVLPSYCAYCWHLGHDETVCHVKHPELKVLQQQRQKGDTEKAGGREDGRKVYRPKENTSRKKKAGEGQSVIVEMRNSEVDQQGEQENANKKGGARDAQLLDPELQNLASVPDVEGDQQWVKVGKTTQNKGRIRAGIKNIPIAENPFGLLSSELQTGKALAVESSTYQSPQSQADIKAAAAVESILLSSTGQMENEVAVEERIPVDDGLNVLLSSGGQQEVRGNSDQQQSSVELEQQGKETVLVVYDQHECLNPEPGLFDTLSIGISERESKITQGEIEELVDEGILSAANELIENIAERVMNDDNIDPDLSGQLTLVQHGNLSPRKIKSFIRSGPPTVTKFQARRGAVHRDSSCHQDA